MACVLRASLPLAELFAEQRTNAFFAPEAFCNLLLWAPFTSSAKNVRRAVRRAAHTDSEITKRDALALGVLRDLLDLRDRLADRLLHDLRCFFAFGDCEQRTVRLPQTLKYTFDGNCPR